MDSNGVKRKRSAFSGVAADSYVSSTIRTLKAEGGDILQIEGVENPGILDTHKIGRI